MSVSEGVSIAEGDNDVIVISVPETVSIPVHISVTISMDSAEKGCVEYSLCECHMVWCIYMCVSSHYQTQTLRSIRAITL